MSFEGGQRVPCIFYWKGHINQGTINNQLVTGLDILPTFAEIAQAALPDHKIDGFSLYSLVRGQTAESPRSDFAYYYRQNNLEAVTDGCYKLVFPHAHRSYEGFIPGNDGLPGKVNEYRKLEEPLLFDLRRDPGERYNLYNALPEVVEQLEQVAEKYRADLGDDLQKVKGTYLRSAGQHH